MSQTAAPRDVRNLDRRTLSQQIQAVLSRLNAPVIAERRHYLRVAFPVLLRLTPLDAERRLHAEEAIEVIGKNISRRGICFHHDRPLPYRNAVIELAQTGLGEFAAEIDINWCRFASPGWYESGGRLLRAVQLKNGALNDTA